jgi:hypothetical protein
VLADEETLLEQTSFVIEGLSLFPIVDAGAEEDWIGVKEEESREEVHKRWLVPLRKAVESLGPLKMALTRFS